MLNGSPNQIKSIEIATKKDPKRTSRVQVGNQVASDVLKSQFSSSLSVDGFPKLQ